ncbi:hypothetical protein DB30_05553 [Enhygromyxa salina]|uniref:Uncharacterized protein n=1 Tax=Enhygromyxa salina TaxID=215803 RepID=A0A0C2D112_9BACT|nr:hypothetical protein DB30_05553 [Enhygromyxa salina]
MDEVSEVLVAGRYSYLRLRGSSPGEWHVVMGRAPRVGDSVHYRAYAVAKNFHSSSLQRDFERLLFTSVKPEARDHDA